MNKFELGVAGAILIGEGILAKLLIDSHNKQIDALIAKGLGTIDYDSFMGIRARKEEAEYERRMDEWRAKYEKSGEA